MYNEFSAYIKDIQMEHTADNVERLATKIVDDWDLNNLMDYAVTSLTNHYMNDIEAFENDWAEEIDD